MKVIRLLPSGDDEKKGDKEEPDVNQSVHAFSSSTSGWKNPGKEDGAMQA